MSENHNKLIILGSGPAGYAASIYAARAGLNPIIIAGMQEGGQLTTTTDVENWPGDSDGLQGPELMERMKKHAQEFDVEIINDHINEVSLTEKPFILKGVNEYSCDSLIIATGASAQYLGLSSEKEFLGKGVSACATCDGFFYKNKVVCVVGGGNTAVEEAIYLSNIAKKVTLIHRREKLRAEAILVDRLMKRVDDNKINILWNTELVKVNGDHSGVSAVTVKNKKSLRMIELIMDGVFIAIGHKPNTQIFNDQVDMKDGYIITKGGFEANSTRTSVPGVFAAGDVQDHTYRQAITSAASGCMAALDAQLFLEHGKEN